jgi:hypothetical protein
MLSSATRRPEFRLRGCGKLSKRRPRRSLWEGTMKRYPAWLSALFLMGACSSGSSQSATLILNNPTWDRVNVEAVITNSADCDNRGKGYVATKNLIMTKGHPVHIEAPNGESICWRKDRNPNNPVPGDWSGWSRIPLAPGQTAETDL